MDKSQVITLVINSVVAITAAIISALLSRNKGSFGVMSRLRGRLTARVRAMIKLVFFFVMFVITVRSLYFLLSDPSPLTRDAVFRISFQTTAALAWLAACGYLTGRVIALGRHKDGD